MTAQPLQTQQLIEVKVAPLSMARFQTVETAERWQKLRAGVGEARQRFQDRVFWNVNSTAMGGGVAEMLHPLLAYARGAGIDARWIVIHGDPEFFRLTKRIHNQLHGSPGDGGELGDEERRIYEGVLEPNGRALLELVHEDDFVLLHDPQTAGLVPVLKERGVRTIWRCHVGVDIPNEISRRAWHFLTPYVSQADALVFSREGFIWEGLRHERTWIIPPSIDAFSPKNRDLDAATVARILRTAGIVAGEAAGATFVRRDGSEAPIEHRAQMIEEAPASLDQRLVVQVSRWDQLKDPLGVIDGFVEHVAPESDAHLVLAGPSVEAVVDDPEGAAVLAEATRRWERLPPAVRPQVHLACLPMNDGEENAAMVNALQRHAYAVVQKSLAEGFGLTVAEAMWKARPVVASKIGGIQDQIEDGKTGLLIDEPTDLAAYGRAVLQLLNDPERAQRMGAEAQQRVREEFLGDRHLLQYMQLLASLP